ncbi:multidrug efflux SMR transporter [Candidatus Bandiella numerosa]|jgi:quaternary ammonium compound-resistance protein SugE|uniref:DMT family transporter n=1 Tax=Candidatus Bandiella numerosa TaxID=2570586 RepID=UPI00249DDF5E|nr:multidrug efflux SMR transporter [Candidatus Bandiella numerosa]WHA04768.1 multidrug efflux SMR transporter [Candidatus Bandiella numerosa]
MISWIYLILAGLFEIVFAIALKLSEDFTKTRWIVVFMISSVFSFYFLSKSLARIPIGTAYLIWSGIGGVGAVMVGIMFFNEPTTPLRLFFMALIIIAMIGLKLY